MPTPDKLLTKEAIAKFEREKKRGYTEKADATRQQSSQMKQKVEQQAKQGTKRLTQQRADRAYNEIESRRKRRDAGITVNNQPVSQRSSDTYAATHGEIKDGNQVQLDNAMAQWGLHSGLGQMTNISDRWRATPSFANFVGRSTPEAMAMAGSLVANPVGTILGMGTGHLGSQAGGYIGEQLGNREAGEIAGSLVGMPFGYKVGTTLQGTVPNYYRNYTLARAINQGVRETELPITRRTISVNRSYNPVQQQPDLVYTLYNEFGEPIGQTNVGGAVFGSGDKSHRMVDGVMSMRNAHKVSEDTYNAAVQDILEGGGKGLESGWSLMSPQKTLAVTKKFPHEVIGQEFGNPVRLLTGTTNRPIPIRVKGNHYQEVKPQYEITYNETTGDFERIPIEKVVNTEGLYNHPGAFLQNTLKETGGITVNGEGVLRKPYQKPESSDWMQLELKEPLMADKPKLSRGQFETLFNSGKIKKPEDLYKYMTTTQAGRIFKMASNVKKALGKFSSSNLHDKKDLQFYNAVLERSTQGLKGTKGTSTAIRQTLADEKARTSEGQYDLYLNNDDAQVLEEIRRQTQKDYGNQISFNEFQGGILTSQNIPKAVAVTPIEIPGVGKFPLMERYLHNARERAEQLLPDLIRKGYMYVDPNTKMWVGSYTPKERNFQPIDPAMFVLSFLKNIRNSSNRVPVFREYSRAGTRELVLPIAWHGTPMGDKPLFTQYKNPTNIKPIFTTVSDGMPGSSNVKEAYQRGGTSIPFLFKRKSYNGRIYQEKSYHPLQGGGNKSTGYILEDGTSIGQLKDHFSGGKGGGTARYVYDVSDQADIPHNSPQPQTEYIFGVGTPEVKSLLNTGDYLPYFNEEGKLIEGVTPFNKRGGKITINN